MGTFLWGLDPRRGEFGSGTGRYASARTGGLRGGGSRLRQLGVPYPGPVVRRRKRAQLIRSGRPRGPAADQDACAHRGRVGFAVSLLAGLVVGLLGDDFRSAFGWTVAVGMLVTAVVIIALLAIATVRRYRRKLRASVSLRGGN